MNGTLSPKWLVILKAAEKTPANSTGKESEISEQDVIFPIAKY